MCARTSSNSSKACSTRTTAMRHMVAMRPRNTQGSRPALVCRNSTARTTTPSWDSRILRALHRAHDPPYQLPAQEARLPSVHLARRNTLLLLRPRLARTTLVPLPSARARTHTLPLRTQAKISIRNSRRLRHRHSSRITRILRHSPHLPLALQALASTPVPRHSASSPTRTLSPLRPVLQHSPLRHKEQDRLLRSRSLVARRARLSRL